MQPLTGQILRKNLRAFAAILLKRVLEARNHLTNRNRVVDVEHIAKKITVDIQEEKQMFQ